MLHLVPGETGGSELYARRLVPALLEAGGPSLTVFAPRAAISSLTAEQWSREVELIGLPVDARSRLRRALAEQTLLPRRARRARIDLLHNLFTTAPALPGAPQVTTILDVIYRRFPETHAGLRGRGLAVLALTAARRSQRIIAISEAARADIVRFLGVPGERVDLTYPGPALPEGETVGKGELRARLGLGEAPIVLTVSAKRPHKNLERLLEAFMQVRAAPAPLLVVPGYETFHEPALRERAAALGASGRIRFTGWLDDAVLDGLFRAATCFVFPSLAEGFGLPVLDALVRGTPVACSNASSLPEVAGDAALYFEPTDTHAIAWAIERLLADGELRERLRAAGTRQAGRFSWAQTAEGTLRSYERALAAR
ncbi:MAG TPA: glycosyltransferase family 1 protein [Gaiellaceae bacterium]|jgi:glycosyltransferase involved in cell wall biosynthesis|nr:glycosyltransferase family 1 protein [Gaiellaceae bacterium]